MERKGKMERLFTAWKLKNLEIQNRICVPPMVCFGVMKAAWWWIRTWSITGPWQREDLDSSSRRPPVSVKMAV